MLSAIFFASGIAGLAFEIVWFYRCSLIFGTGVWATSLVLSSFMGGLALGNALVARAAKRIRAPLRAYAAAELIVAITGLLLSYTLSVRALNVLTTFALLLIPATAMGASFPLLVGEMCRWRLGVGSALGRLYGWNTLGAMCGALGAEIVLVRHFGVTGTAWIASGIDAGIAAIALRLARHDSPPSRLPSSDPPPQRGANSERLILFSGFFSGAVLLGLEVVWFRFLSMYVLTTTLAMSMMLAVVLAAIGLGGLLAAKWLAIRIEAVRYLPAISLSAGCTAIASYGSFQWLTHGTQVGDWRQILWFGFVLTFPTSLLSGMIFTLLGDALARDIRPGARAAASLTLANASGSACGPLLAAFVLLPVIGMERSVFALAFGYAAIALLATLALASHRVRLLRPLTAATVGVLLAILTAFPFGLIDRTYFARAAAPYATDGSEIIATRDGPAETILLMRQTWLDKPVYHRLVTNGFSMSGTAIPAMRYMRAFVYLPALLHKTPVRRVLVVCYGVGVTAGAATDIESAESIDVAEISPDVVAMSDLIYAPEQHPLRDPRVHLHIEDGRHFLAATNVRFDLITGEPPPPRTPGAVTIYTREYFRLVYDRLAEGGVSTYWLPVGRPDPGTDVNTIIRAFCDVFEDCSLWNATPFDFMLLGSRASTSASLPPDASLAGAWRGSRLAGNLRQVGFESPGQIGATFLGDSMYLRELTADTPPLTDDYPQRLRPDPARPSLSDPRFRDSAEVAALYQRVIEPGRARRAFATSAFVRRLFPAELITATLPYFEVQRMINRVLWEGGQPLRLIDDLDTALTQTSLQTLPLWMLGSDDVKEQIAESSPDGGPAIEYALGLRALAAREYLDAASKIAAADRDGLRGVTIRPLLAYALYRGGRTADAERLARDAEPRTEQEIYYWNWLRARIRAR